MEEQYHTLRTSPFLRVTTVSPGAALPPAGLEDVQELIIQPRAPWFSAAKRKHLEGALRGSLGAAARSCSTVGWIDDKPVGNVYYSTATGRS